MRWKDRPRQPEEPQLGPELSPEMRKAMFEQWLRENDARHDAAYERIRTQSERRSVSAGEDWASPAT